MKTKSFLTVIGAVALVAITINLNAGEPLRSPRALDNEIKAAPAAVEKATIVTESHQFTGSPRALDHQANHGKGTLASANLTARKCAVIGSPRQAGNSTLSCCKVAKASCTAALACCKK
jgi:hypothetical protein